MENIPEYLKVEGTVVKGIRQDVDRNSIKEIEIPEGVTEIAGYAFEDCESLTSVKIPVSVVDIGSFAFYECASLARIAIPEGVTSIGEYAFGGCANLEIVEYGGTKEQWKQIQIVRLGTSSKFVVHCADGDIT